MTLHTFEYPPVDGGISRLCAEIAGGYAREGRVLRVLAQEAEAEGSVVPASDVVRMTARRPRREWDALRWLRGHRSGPVVTGIWYPEGLLAVLAGARPHVILAHGSELLPTPSRWRRGTWARLQRRVLESADLVVANSAFTEGLVRKAAPSARIVAIPLAVDHRRFCPGNRDAAKERLGVVGKCVVATVARLNAYKGHETVLRALTALPSEQRTHFVYLIAGRGPFLADLERLTHELHLDGVVRFMGYVSEAELPDLYRASDLFVLPTRDETDNRDVEGFGLVFLEAQACGCPVVGANTGGIPDAVKHGDGGWLIEQDDAHALQILFGRLDDHPDEFIAMGAKGRARVEREGTWDGYMARFTAALEREGIMNDARG